MSPEAPGIFALPDHLAHKADPAHIAADERHLAAISHALDQKVASLSARLDARRRDPAGRGAQTIERDADIRRLVAELATLRRFGLDVCIGHYATAAASRAPQFDSSPTAPATAPVYVGRIGLLRCGRHSPPRGLAHPGRRAVLRRDARRSEGRDVSPSVPVVGPAHRGLLG